MLNDENIISKSRSIIDLRNVNFTIQEFRLMEVYLSKINPQDETTASVTFTKQEYCDLRNKYYIRKTYIYNGYIFGDEELFAYPLK